MNQYYDKSYGQRIAHRFHVRRRAVKKLSLLFLVLGMMCIFISVVMFALAYAGTATQRHIRLVLSLGYVGMGVGMVLLRWIIETLRNRASSNRHRSHYQPKFRDPAEFKEAGAFEAKPAAAIDPPGDEDGAVLVMVLVILALVAGLLVEAQISAQSSLRRQERALLKTRLHQAAAGAAWAALHRLADDEDLSVDTTNETWALPEEAKDPSGVSTRVLVTDRDRLFDINNLAVERVAAGARPVSDVLMDIMTLCGDFSPVERVEALKDWIDADDEGFAEKSLYRQRKPPYEPANRPFYAPSELLWVNGFDRKYFARHVRHNPLEVFSADVVDCLAVNPVARNVVTPINMNTARKEVLLGVFGVTEDAMVRQVMARRDERPIRSVAQFYAELAMPVPEALAPYLDVKSRFFAIDAQAYAEGQTEHLLVLAQRGTAGNVDVLQWVF